eukprot:Selendium_serpulae@DN6391_c0_g1_i1.p1
MIRYRNNNARGNDQGQDYEDQEEEEVDYKHEYEGELEDEYEEEEGVQQEEEAEADEGEETVKRFEPNSRDEIETKVFVKQTREKGRCLYSRTNLKPGDIIFIEKPVMVAVPGLDKALWKELSKLHEESPMELPPIWHLAALCSITKLKTSKRDIIGDKWIPDTGKDASDDVHRVLDATGLTVDPNVYERFLQAWRFNSFGHHTESDGLVLYDRISMMAHNCNSSACWHYGEGDTFVLRARQFIAEGEELTISYIGDDDLFKSTPTRRDKLAGWQFTCHCPRCDADLDLTRGFRCPDCGSGTTFFRTDEENNTTCNPCSVCHNVMSSSKITQYLEFEEAYIARLDETGKDDLDDAELVLTEAQRVFKQHWALFALHTTLFEGRRDEGYIEEAIHHQKERIYFVSTVLPKATYTLAWLYEELGDLESNRISSNLHDETSGETPALTNHQRNTLSRIYEDGMNLLLILCGENHDYTMAIFKRIQRIAELPDGLRQ